MTPSSARTKAKRKWFSVVVAPCVLGMLLVPLTRHAAVASPPPLDVDAQARRAAVNLRLNQASVTRLMAELSSGAAQENDGEKPKPMGSEATAPPPTTDGQAAAVKKEAPPEDKFAFVKDWPFWVIVGGGVIALAGGYMLLRNSNQEAPCGVRYTAGCYP